MSAIERTHAPGDGRARAGRGPRPTSAWSSPPRRRRANLRWADNTLTTNGVSRSRQLTVIAIDAAPRAPAGVVSRAGVTPGPARGWSGPPSRRRAEAAPGRGRRAAGRPARPGRRHTTWSRWDAPPAGPDRGVLAFAAELGEAFAPGRRPPGGGCTASPSTSWPPPTWAPPPGCGCGTTSRPGGVELNAQVRPTWPARPGPGAATRRLHRRGRRPAWTPGWPAARLGQRAIELPAGRYETVLPPTAVADLMSTCTGRRAPGTPRTGARVFSRPGGGTRVGERLTTLPLDAAQRPGRRPGWRARRS